MKKQRPWLKRAAGIVIAALVGASALAIGFMARIGGDSTVIGNQVELNLTGGTKGSFVVSSQQRALGGGPRRGLFPGGAERLVLTVTNPNSFEIVVRSITVDARAANDGCGARNLVTSDFTGPPLYVPRDGTRQVRVPISMRPNSADACQGARFPLVFGGTATKR